MTIKEAEKELGISSGSTRDEITKAYRQRCEVTHPDKGGSEQAFKRTNDAYGILSGKIKVTAGNPGPGPTYDRPSPPPRPTYHDNRESWLGAAAIEIIRHAAAAGLEIPIPRISTGFGFGGRRHTRGFETIKATKDRIPQIFISPEIDDTAKALTATFEAIKLVTTRINATALDSIWPIAEPLITPELGSYPHTGLRTGAQAPKKQTTRLLKAHCPDCGYTVRVAAGWANQYLPTCTQCGSEFELAN